MDDFLARERAERSLLGSLIIGRSLNDVRDVIHIVSPEDFTNEQCANVFKAIVSLNDKGKPPDLVSVGTELKAMNLKADNFYYLPDEDTSQSPINVAYFIAEKARKDRLTDKFAKIFTELNSENIDTTDAMERVERACKDEKTKLGGDIAAINDIALNAEKEWEERHLGGAPQGVMCGIRYIDERGGLIPSDLNIIAGRTSNGKTSFGLSMIINIALNKVPCAIYSLEMSMTQIFTRMTAMASGIDAATLQYGRIDEYTLKKVIPTANMIGSLPIYYDNNQPNTAKTIATSITSMVEWYGVKVVLIDYIQLFSGPEREPRLLIGNAANMLKQLAKRLNIVIMLVSQLSRPTYGRNNTPRISELKESGDIENAADNIYLIYRPELYNEDFPDGMSGDWSKYETKGNAILIHPKARNGRIGESLLGFDPPTTFYFDRKDGYNLKGEKPIYDDEKVPF